MLQPGQLQLHDSAVPDLRDGTYRITLTPRWAAGVEGTPPQSSAFDLVVGDTTSDADVLAVHPAAGADGAFGDALPFVVLRRRTLPWERSGFGQSGMPWLTVVLTREGEGAEAVLAADGSLRCVDAATQARLLARPQEVRLLSHVREVHAGDTLAGLGDDDGWQAVVVANRFPRTPGLWRASLVSLDRRDDLLGNAPTLGLSVLRSWTFTVSAGTHGFLATMSALTPEAFAAPANHPFVDATGAVALQKRDRGGRTHSVRYRSPLAPSAASSPPPAPATVEPDVTEQAAFALGRALAMADGRLLRELAHLRAGALQQKARAQTAASLVGSVGAAPMRAAGLAPEAAAPAVPVHPHALAAASVARWRDAADVPDAGRRGAAAPGLAPARGER